MHVVIFLCHNVCRGCFSPTPGAGLLADAKAGKNPFEGLTPEVPMGERLTGETGPGSKIRGINHDATWDINDVLTGEKYTVLSLLLLSLCSLLFPFNQGHTQILRRKAWSSSARLAFALLQEAWGSAWVIQESRLASRPS